MLNVPRFTIEGECLGAWPRKFSCVPGWRREPSYVRWTGIENEWVISVYEANYAFNLYVRAEHKLRVWSLPCSAAVWKGVYYHGSNARALKEISAQLYQVFTKIYGDTVVNDSFGVDTGQPRDSLLPRKGLRQGKSQIWAVLGSLAQSAVSAKRPM